MDMGHGHHHHGAVQTGEGHDPSSALFAGWSAIVIVSIMIFAKIVAYLMSGSVSVLSSLIDSVADIMMSIMALISVKMSLKPADDCHRSGHGKIEGLFALGQAAFIFVAGIAVIYSAIQNIITREVLTDQYLASAIIILSIALTFVLTTIQKRAVRKSASMAIEADHAHYHSDIFMNGGVLLVLLATAMGAPSWIDAVVALLIAGYVWWIAYGVGKSAIDMLLDREIDQEIRQQIMDIVLSHTEVKDMHDLRAIRSGMKMLVSFDIEVDPNILLWTAHEIALSVERDVVKNIPNAEVMIHVDPAGGPMDLRHSEDVHT